MVDIENAAAQEDAVQELARYMRELLVTHGSPSYGDIIKRVRKNDQSSSLSQGTLTHLFKGRGFSRRENVEAVARALGGQAAATEALRLWDAARRQRNEAEAAGRTVKTARTARTETEEAPDDAAPAGGPVTSRRRLTPWGVATAAAATLLAAGGGVWLLTDHQAPAGAADGRTGASAAPSAGHGPAPLSSADGTSPDGPVWTGKPPLAVRAAWSDGECPTIWYDGPPEQYFTAWKNHTKDATATELVSDQYSPPVDMTVQGRTEESVLLTGMEVTVLRSAPPPTRGVVINTAFGCGAAQPQRSFTADFARRPVKVTADAGQDNDGKAIPPVRFPFKVSLTDPEDFLVKAKNVTGDCAFAIVLHWVADGKAGTTTLNNGGKGFRLIKASSLPAYRFNGDMERPALERVSSS
ncbi:hypothetical protein J1792_32600 [Streptomyces triculaminicus]|uniref:Transcriptional regulator n=1 Tax=Streptomyces triculaminicus TaxID=2816232 RepID=A0A939JUA5_9ACTN|nr:hypothetical protein [Streptomyces triculaminicus]MBO0657285.1 hypothetical protein [Streptomyces triculaminicus]